MDVSKVRHVIIKGNWDFSNEPRWKSKNLIKWKKLGHQHHHHFCGCRSFQLNLSFHLTASFEATIQRPSLPQPQCLLFRRYPSIDRPCRNVCSPSAFKQKIRKNKQNFKNKKQVKCGRLSKINKGDQQTTFWFCVIPFSTVLFIIWRLSSLWG